jgi:hypothetical protein
MNDNNRNRTILGGFEIGTLATLAPVLLILLLLVKVYGVARFSLTTAAALVTASPLSVLVGTLTLYQYASMAIVAGGSLLLSIAWYWYLYPSSGASDHRIRSALRVLCCHIGIALRHPIKQCRITLVGLEILLFRLCRHIWFTLRHPIKQCRITLIRSTILLARSKILLFRFGTLLRGRGPMRHLVPLTFLLMLFSVLLTPFYYLIPAGIASVTVLILWSFLQKKVSLPALVAYAGVVALSISIILTLETPWVPAEVVSLKHPILVNLSSKPKVMSQYPVAFVVSDENGWTAMLVNGDRYLAWVRDSDITGRTICRLNGQLRSYQTVYLVLRRQPYTSPNVDCDGLSRSLTKEIKH